MLNSTTINWLHLTDLHMGQTGQSHLWPNLRAEFERDLSERIKVSGPIDIVFFSGDLVQSGERKQFELLESALLKLWDFLKTVGSTPVLVSVPGNHDLRRPDPSKSAAMALLGWHQHANIREVFWRDERSDIRKCVNKCFEEYTKWTETTRIPLLKSQKGMLPGDFSATYSKGSARVGIVGLNSSFLHLSTDSAKAKLAVSVRQLKEACSMDYVEWLDSHQFNVLMTHHPKSWFCEDSLAEFSRDIAPDGRFRAHLCGHLHHAATKLNSEGGSVPTLYHQGASLFGLEFRGPERKEVRHHGYLLGQWVVNSDIVQERLWPRIAVRKDNGALGVVQNPGSHLESDGAIHYEFSKRILGSASPTHTNVVVPQAEGEDFLSATSGLGEKIKNFPKFSLVAQTQHLSIRSDERVALVNALKEQRKAALIADWGTGKDGFLASVVNTDDSTVSDLNFQNRVFHYRCDTFESVSDFEQGFPSQFGVSVTEFHRCFSDAGNCCLLLDGIQPAVVEGEAGAKLIQLVDLILDYAPNLSIIVIGRSAPAQGFKCVEISSLDLPDFRSYVERHPEFQNGLLRPEPLDRLFEAAGGLPISADRILDKMRFASFDAVIAEENEIIQNVSAEIPLHKALQRAIESTRLRDKEDSSRSIKLLQTLSLLVYGETIEQLKHFYQKDPLFPRDVKILDEAGLVEIISLQSASPIISSRLVDDTGVIGPKLLRIPKQVRDCVITSLSSADRKEILSAAGEFYFGKGWRTGKKPKLRKIPLEYRGYTAHGPGNEYSVIQLMITRAKEAEDRLDLKASVRLALHYCGVLKGAARNRDLRIVSQNLLRLLEGVSLRDEICELNRLCGRACRLTAHYEEAVKHFRVSLDETVGKLPQESKHYALLEMSDALRVIGNEQEATESAKQVLGMAKPNSLMEHQARSKLIFDSDSASQLDQLKEMEATAREKTWISHANDLSLMIQPRVSGLNEKLKCLDSVLDTEVTGWNRHRAIVEKSLLLVRNKKCDKLTAANRVDLRHAYAYCYSQRLKLFDRCHEALWGLLEGEGRQDQLFVLFQHSSFIWRIRGDLDEEAQYFDRLNSSKNPELSERSLMMIEFRYFSKRAKILLARLASMSKN